MGFGKGAAAEALKRSNNDIALSFQVMLRPALDSAAAVETIDMTYKGLYSRYMSFDLNGARVGVLDSPATCFVRVFVKLLHEQPELHNLPDPDPPHVDISEEMILQVTAMGFDVDMARAALHHFSANVSQAVEELVRMEGVVPPEWLQALQVASASSSNTSSSVSSKFRAVTFQVGVGCARRHLPLYVHISL
jgi:hypothetical protein